MINRTGLRTYAIPLSLVLVLGCSDNDTDCLAPPADVQPNVDISDMLPPVRNSTEMRSIIPDELPRTWEHSNNYSKDGMVTMVFKKPGDHRVTIIVVDKRTKQMAGYAVTPCNFSDEQGSYIIGENDKIVDMSKLMEALRFS